MVVWGALEKGVFGSTFRAWDDVIAYEEVSAYDEVTLCKISCDDDIAYDEVRAYDDDTISFVTCKPSLLVNVIIFPVTEDDTYEALRSPSKYDAVRAYDAEVAV